MLLKVKSLNLATGKFVAILHEKTAKALAIYAGGRIRLKAKHSIVCIVDVAKGILKENEIAVSSEVLKILNIFDGYAVEVNVESPPESTRYILEKLKGGHLSKEKLVGLVGDIVHNTLTEAELAYFIAGVYINGMSDTEIADLIKSMVFFGKKLNLKKVHVFDKHSIGGIAGNRTTPLIVSICASAGITIPKTSSRAITSAAGTADVVESFAKVEFTVDEIKKIVLKTNACMVWGGSLGLAPADDKLIQVERVIAIDPEAQLIASILAKKLAIGAKGILLDIPYGPSAKVKSKREAVNLGNRFRKIAQLLRLKLKVIATDGSQPIGNGVGPVLEAVDIIKILKQQKDRPLDLEKKAVFMSSLLLEMAGRAKPGKGIALAQSILSSGKAYKKFLEIVDAQNGSSKDIEKKLSPARYSLEIKAEKSGKIKSIDNKKIAAIAKASGCPADKSSGVYLCVHVGNSVSKGDTLLKIFAETEERISFAKETCRQLYPVSF